jgi:predicted ATPase
MLASLGFVVRHGATPRGSLLDALAGRQTLLVIVNCEHLLGEVVSLCTELLHSAPAVRVLATSREPLGISGEWVWTVEPLDVERDAVDLFAERAAAARHGFTLTGDDRRVVAEICRQLDGLPLAIELAAARVRLLSPRDLLARLGERFRLLAAPGRFGEMPPRQATLRATVD